MSRGVNSPDPAKAKPAVPVEVKPGKGAPNVVLILVDDVGFRCNDFFWRCDSDPEF